MKNVRKKCYAANIAIFAALTGFSGTNVYSAEPYQIIQEHKAMNQVITKINELPVGFGITSPMLSFSPDGGRVAIRTADNTITVWDWKKNDVIAKLSLPDGANDGGSRAFQFSPDGKRFATCHTAGQKNGAIEIWNTSTWKIEGEIGLHAAGNGCTAVSFSPDGKHLIRLLQKFQRQAGNTLEIYDTQTWQIQRGIRTNPLDNEVLAISHDGKRMVIGGTLIPLGIQDDSSKENRFNALGKDGESYIAILDFPTLNLIGAYKSKNKVTRFSRIAWNSDDTRVVHAANHGLEIFNSASFEKNFDTPSTVSMAVVDIAYTADGKYLIEGQGEAVNVLRIRDAKQNNLIQTEATQFGTLDVTKDSKYLATSQPGKVIIWQFNK